MLRFFLTLIRICWSIGHFKLVYSFVNSKPPGRKMVDWIILETNMLLKVSFVDYSWYKCVGLLHHGCWDYKPVHWVSYLHYLWSSLLHNDICIQVNKTNKTQDANPENHSEFYKICVCLMVGVANASSALQASITTNSRFEELCPYFVSFL